MAIEMVFELVWKSSLCAALSLLILRAMRSRSAAEKSLVAHFGLLTVLLLPFGTLFLPRIEVEAPAAMMDRIAMLPAESAPVLSAMDMPVSPAIDWSALVMFGYIVPAVLLLLCTIAGLLHLGRLRDRAKLVMDSFWLDALASARKRLNSDQSAELLASGELKSPVSWGILRPVIIVNVEGVKDAASAEAIIVHELAHLTRFDWLNLLIAHLVTALFWFNPLVWVLSRTAHELSEQAADDVVLRSEIGRMDYAEVLISAARNANGGSLRNANGIAPEARALGRRVLGILDPKRSRVPARLGWSATCLSSALAVGTCLAALQPTVAAAADEIAMIGGRHVEAVAPPAWLENWQAWKREQQAVRPAEPVKVAEAAKRIDSKPATVSVAARDKAPPPIIAIADAKATPVTLRPPPPPVKQVIVATETPLAPEPASLTEAMIPALAEIDTSRANTLQRVSCRRYAMTGSRTRSERVCMTESEWWKRQRLVQETSQKFVD
jgi:bla regulator protein blaR1